MYRLLGYSAREPEARRRRKRCSRLFVMSLRCLTTQHTVVTLKVVHSSLQETHRKATERQLPYGIIRVHSITPHRTQVNALRLKPNPDR